jgi:hypothetical protein
MNVYYTGKILDQTPTGLGGYTGLVLTNSGNFTVTYNAVIGDTTLYKNGDTTIVPSSDIENGANTNTIFIAEDILSNNINDSSLSLTVDPSSSGVFYVLHRPFSEFTAGNESTGYEVARITINTVSSAGDTDNPILVDISGQRVYDNPTPSRIGKFYAVKSYSEATSYQLEFFWNTLSPTNYVKRFVIDISSDTGFTSIIYSYTGDIVLQNDSDKPRFGDYNGFINDNFSVKINQLSVGQDYYARIQGINFDNEPGPYSYPTGYSYNNPILNPTGISGLFEAPGANLKSDASILYLTKTDDYEENFNIYDFIKQNNNNSSDFRFYSGVNIKFNSSSNSLAKYIATTVNSGGINFVVPNSDDFKYAVNANNIFTIELEFNNIAVLGRGGEGVKWQTNGTFINAKNGGPCINFDSYFYDSKPIEFRLYKDLNSLFYGGPGGGQGWAITDTSTTDINQLKLDGAEIESFDGFDLRQFIP